MKTITLTLFPFSELSAEAQGRAIDFYRSADADWLGTEWDGEWNDSRQAFLDYFGAKLHHRGEHVVSVPNPAGYHGEDPLTGVRLWKHLVNSGLASGIEEDCPFTGVTSDESYLDGIRTFLKKPDRLSSFTLLDLVRWGLQAGDSDWESEREWGASDEVIRERLEDSDDILFLEDGSLYTN